MKAIRKEPGKLPEVIEVENTRNALRSEVGGPLEAVTVADDTVILCDEQWRIKEKAYCCKIFGMTFGGTVLVVGTDGEDFRDIEELDAVLWVLFRMVRYGRADRANNVWRCRRCGHLERFEADGPYENGWNLCPHCGGILLLPRSHGAAEE